MSRTRSPIPEKFVDKIVAANPNIEVVSRDGDGRMTLRDRNNGKTVQINFDDFRRNGLHVFDGDKNVKIGPRGIEVRDGDKQVHVGASASAHVPAWIPAYPGSKTQVAVDEGDSGTVAFSTADSAAQVASYYVDALTKKAGFTASREGDTVTAKANTGARELTVQPDNDHFKMSTANPSRPHPPSDPAARHRPRPQRSVRHRQSVTARPLRC